MQLPPNEPTLVTILRGLLIAEIVILVVAIPLILVSGAMAEAALQERGLADEVSDAEMVVAAFSCMFFVVIVPALIVSWIGLFKFWSWSRWLYLATNAIGSLVEIPIGFLDFSFQWGLPNVFLGLGQLVTGAILAIVFLTPLANRFQPAQVSNITPPPVPEL